MDTFKKKIVSSFVNKRRSSYTHIVKLKNIHKNETDVFERKKILTIVVIIGTHALIDFSCQGVLLDSFGGLSFIFIL
jgi:hypothetical protein